MPKDRRSKKKEKREKKGQWLLHFIVYALYAPLGLCPKLFMTTFSSGQVKTPSSSLYHSVYIYQDSKCLVSVACFAGPVVCLFVRQATQYSHCYFTRLNLKKMGPLQFCLPVFLGIHRNPKQKEFLNSCEGFLK